MQNFFYEVPSECSGTIASVLVNENEYVYEWEPLFIILDNKVSKIIEVGMSGKISSIKVKPGDIVVSGMTLAVIKEEGLPCGSD